MFYFISRVYEITLCHNKKWTEVTKILKKQCICFSCYTLRLRKAPSTLSWPADKFKNATLFLRLRLPSTLIRINCPSKTNERGTFGKRFLEWMKLKIQARRSVSVWTKNFCCVFKVKMPFSNLSGVV